MSQLMQACSPATTDELVDIREVAVDKALPKEERIAAFLHQIKNPDHVTMALEKDEN